MRATDQPGDHQGRATDSSSSSSSFSSSIVQLDSLERFLLKNEEKEVE